MNLAIGKNYHGDCKQLVVFLTDWFTLSAELFDVVNVSYVKWESLLMLDVIEEKIAEIFSSLPKLETVVFMGFCKNSVATIEMANRFIRNPKFNQKIHFGLMCQFGESFKDRNFKSAYKDKIQSYLNVKDNPKYIPFFEKYGSAKERLEFFRQAPVDYTPGVIAVYSYGDVYLSDERVCVSLGGLLDKIYSTKAPDSFRESLTHVLIQRAIVSSTTEFMWLFEEAFKLSAEGSKSEGKAVWKEISLPSSIIKRCQG